ncbi:MAG TPA: DUF6088 family protein [Chitinophagales bacterium]|nr:DUF6088 family protein [Chitinophagales bacterium]
MSIERPKIEAKIAEILQDTPKGSILFVADFLDSGSPDSIKKALYRLTNEKNLLIRLAHGVYLYPKTDKELGTLYPSTEEIAKAIARRDKARIIPTGVYALNRLGLSTQVPMKIVYLTDGATRSIKIGKRTISFKRTSPRNLMTIGKISTLAIQALKEIGQENVDDEILKQLKVVLKKETQENILHDAKLAPAWINKILKQSLK